MYRAIVIALLLMINGQALAHSLEPSYRVIRFHQGFSRFPMEAVNAYSHSQVYEVEVFEDDSFSTQLVFNASPNEIYLQPGGRREFTIEMDEVDLDDFLVCTHAQLDGARSRVCSRVLVCRPEHSTAECKRRVSKRRGEYVFGR